MPILTLHYRNQNPTGSPSTDDDKYSMRQIILVILGVILWGLNILAIIDPS